jgi:hypothetical protein
VTVLNPGVEPEISGSDTILPHWTTVAGSVTYLLGTGGRTNGTALISTTNAVYSEIRSDQIAVLPGLRYRVSLWWKHHVSGVGVVPLYVRIVDGSGAVVGAAVAGPFPTNTSTWTKAEVTLIAPPGATHMTIGAIAGSLDSVVGVYIDDVEAWVQDVSDGVISTTGSNLVIGEPFLGEVVTMEPSDMNTGPIVGKKKRYMDISVRLYQSALPKINGDRPSDYDAVDYRANPGALRTGRFKVNTSDWDDGSITIQMDLPHRTEVVALYGDLKVN